MKRAWLVAGVASAWSLVALVWASQSALGAALQGDPVAFSDALRSSAIQTLPWIPVTLLVVFLALRFPVGEGRWRRTAWIHLAAVPVVAFLSNVGVVAGFWLTAGRWDGITTLAEQGAFWGSQRLAVSTALYLVIAGLTWGFRYRRRLRERELALARRETQVAEARLQALTAQIRPHFLFNTLHTIGQLWRSGRSDEADLMLDHLGALFQRVQSTTDRPTVTLEEELEMVEDYLAIERARFRDRLTTRVEAPPELLSAQVPPLLLQPLVENAIRHGVSKLRGRGEVVVRAAREDGALVLEVENDGPGPGDARSAGAPDGAAAGAPEAAGPTPGGPRDEPGIGTGLRTTRARVAELYGDGASLTLGGREEGGARARVVLPASGPRV